MKPDWQCNVCGKQIDKPLIINGEVYVLDLDDKDFILVDGYYLFCGKRCFMNLVFSNLTSEETGADMSGS